MEQFTFGNDSDKFCMKSLISDRLCWYDILLPNIHCLTGFLKITFKFADLHIYVW